MNTKQKIIKMVYSSLLGIFPFVAYAQTVTIQDLPEFDTVVSINNDNLIAGIKDRRAVIAKAGEIPTFIDGGLGSDSFPRFINDHGQVVGEYSEVPPTGGRQAFVFDPNLGTIDLFIEDTFVFSSINNNLGQVFWETSHRINDEQWINVFDENGIVQSIVAPGALIFDANDIGQALSTEQGRISGVFTLSNTSLSHEKIEDPNSFYTELYDINNLGQAVGRVAGPNPNKAVIWEKNSGLRDLLTPEEAGDFTSIASVINDSGLVALTLIPSTGFQDSEFAFYLPGKGLVRLTQPDIPKPSACKPGTFHISTFSGIGIFPTRDETLNELGQAIVRVQLSCQVGNDHPIISIPAVATINKGIQLLPLPRGLVIEDLFTPVTNDYGQVNIYRMVETRLGGLNDRGKMVLNFITTSWDWSLPYTSTAHLYDVGSPKQVLSCVGFQPPMSNYPVTIKGNNRVLPLKAQLFDANTQFVTNDDIKSLPIVQVIFTPTITDEEPINISDNADSVGLGTEGNQFVFSGDHLWKFNLKTSEYTIPGMYTITIRSGDESKYLIDPPCKTKFVIE